MPRKIKIGRPFELSIVAEEEDQKSNQRTRQQPLRRVTVGEAFDAKVTISIVPDKAATDAETRRLVVMWVLTLSTIFLSGAAMLGLYRDDFSSLNSIWVVVGPIYGAMATYFFSSRRTR
jgi:hypothetical protein